MNMASHCIDIGKSDLAIFYCDRVLAVDTDMVTANVYRAYALQARGRFDDAVRECQHIIARYPGNADASALLGSMYESGQGVVRDLVQADFWFIAAAASGDSTDRENQFLVERKMTRVDINQARMLAQEWIEKHKFSMPVR